MSKSSTHTTPIPFSAQLTPTGGTHMRGNLDICAWNLSRLAETLLPLLHDKTEAVEAIKYTVRAMKKIGYAICEAQGDAELAAEFWH